MSGFTGFGEDAVEFYDGLGADNSRAYWTDHRPTYERDVRTPMQALLADLEPEFGAGTVFRPHRDVRFSHDKTPYKTHCGGYAPPFYVEVSSEGLMAAGGYYLLAPDQLGRYRAAVDDDRRGEDLAARLRAAGTAGLTVGGELLTTRPRGVDPAHPRRELLRPQGRDGSRRGPPDDALHGPAARTRVREVWRAARPLAEWLADHVGPSEQPRR